MHNLYSNREQIKQFGAKRIGVFGSFVKNKQNPKSDIDIIIEFKQGNKNYDNFINLNFYLEKLFKKKLI